MIPFIALVEDDEVFDAVTHRRQDLGVPGSVRISQSEGELATASMQVLNNRVPLSALEGQRVLISDRGNLLFDGKLTAVPRGLVSGVVSVEAIARPADLDAQLAALVEELKVAPYYDPLFVPQGEEEALEEVLAGYSKVLAYSRTGGGVQAVDALGGATELSLMPAHGSLWFDKVAMAPAYGIEMTVAWRQLGVQTLHESEAFSGFSTMTPDDVKASFPAVGAGIGAGFTVRESVSKEKVDAFGRTNRETILRAVEVSSDELDPAWIEEEYVVEEAEICPMTLSLSLEYRYEANRVETCAFSIPVGVQETAWGEEEEEIEEVTLRDITEPSSAPRWRAETQYYVDDEVLDGGNVYRATEDHLSSKSREAAKWTLVGESSYLASRRQSSFLLSERGQAALAHAVERVRARARIASRCITVSFEALMPDPWTVTEDCTVRMEHAQIPGGYVAGRLTRYDLSWEPGRRTLSGTIAVAPGLDVADDATVSASDADIPYAGGRMSVEIVNSGETQKAAFLALQEVGATSITISTAPTEATEYEAEIPVTVSGTIGIPEQVII